MHRETQDPVSDLYVFKLLVYFHVISLPCPAAACRGSCCRSLCARTAVQADGEGNLGRQVAAGHLSDTTEYHQRPAGGQAGTGRGQGDTTAAMASAHQG